MNFGEQVDFEAEKLHFESVRMFGIFYYYTHLRPPFQASLAKTVKKGRTILEFNEARDDGVAVTTAGPYAYHLHFSSDSTTTSLNSLQDRYSSAA